MDDRMERWTVTAFDDAAARIPLPPRERWLPRDRRGRTPFGAIALTAAAIALTIGAAWLVMDGRIVPAAPSARPAPSGLIPLAPGGTEAQTWGKVWSVTTGATVLRPTWLPIADSDTSYSVETGSRGLHRYVVGYYPKNVFPPGPRPFRLLFIAEGPDVLPPTRGPGETSEDVTVRGQSGRLLTATDGAPRVIWTEDGIRYTIQAVAGISASDVLRIAESLKTVTDADGTTR
jgi:hypothetical protein